MKRIILIFYLLLLVGCSGGESNAVSSTTAFEPNMLNEHKVVLTIGTSHDQYMAKHFPDADVLRVESLADIAPMVQSGKAVYGLLDMLQIRDFLKGSNELEVVTDNLFAIDVGAVINKKNRALHAEFNEFLAEFIPSVTYADIRKRWIDGDGGGEIPVIEVPTTGKTLRIACTTASPPAVTMVNNRIEGYEIEIIKHFAKRGGYQLEIMDMNFPAIISSIGAGAADIAISDICITEERQKSLLFSDPYHKVATGVIARKKQSSNNQTQESFIDNLSQSFYDNIIKEDRYILVLNGLYITILISIFSILLGTIFGAGVCFLSMHRSAFLSGLASGYITIVRGTPVLILLMINFYIIFAHSSIAPELVAIFAFALNFAAYVSEMFRTSIESIDKGQREAGLAMGFSKIKTFIFIIAPQAIKRVLPVYKGEAISLIKMTSVVGYIAVQDITKVGDIIRSRTFDAFFPLLVSALLYFLLAYLFTKILDLLTSKIISRNYDNN